MNLNRFPLFGAFAYRAAVRIGHTDSEARLLGYSTALLYAIFAKGRGGHGGKKTSTVSPVVSAVHTDPQSVRFGGMDFRAEITDRVVKTFIGDTACIPADYTGKVESKFRDGWHGRLCNAFDALLAGYEPVELQHGQTLYNLYKTWRDSCKAGFGCDLEAVERFCLENRKVAA